MMKKNEGLTKEDLCWVLVKLAGAVLVYQAAAAFYGVLLMVTAIDGPLRGTSVGVVFFTMLLPLVVGIWLLVSGRALHDLLMMGPSTSQVAEGAKPVGGTTLAERRLTEEEYEKYQNWIEKNPEVMRRDEVDRLALFRDAEKAGEA